MLFEFVSPMANDGGVVLKHFCKSTQSLVEPV